MDRDIGSEKKTSIYRAIDLFAGIGGIRLGFQQAFQDKIKFVFSNEIDDFSCETYEANFGENPKGDITKVDEKEIPDFDILLAGFPCQAFSIAGEKRGFQDTRGTLFFHIVRILKEKQPMAFLLENVKHLKHHDNGRTLQVIKDVLRYDLGYHIHIKVLNAANYGLPQKRKRIFIVGFKDNYAFNFPKPNAELPTLNSILEPKGTVDENFYLSHEYLEGLKKHRRRHESKGHGFGYEVIPRNALANTIVCGGMGKERNLVKDKILANCWKEEGDDIQLRNEEGIRKMTPKEWQRLQGFPENFKFPVSKTQKYKQLGNSVPVAVIKAIAEQMKKTLEEKKTNPLEFKNRINIQIFDLLEKMKEKNVFTKTGRKNKESFFSFIKDSCLRINNVETLIEKMKETGIILDDDPNHLYFQPKFKEIDDPNEFRNLIKKKLKENSAITVLSSFINVD